MSGEREIPETGLARAGQEVRPSVVLTTYEQPRALELVLWGYAAIFITIGWFWFWWKMMWLLMTESYEYLKGII